MTQRLSSGAEVEISERVREAISAEVLQAYNAVPRRGAETGGILLGRRTETGVRIEDFEPVLCEHRFGPSYLLSEEDLQGLEESLEWFRGRGEGAPEVLGMYRSQTRSEDQTDEHDAELMRRYFGEGDLFLLLTPHRDQSVTWEFSRPGEKKPEPEPEPEPLPEPQPVPAREHQEALAQALAAARERSTQATRERATVTRAPERRNLRWVWVAVVAAATLIGGILGYRSGDPAPKAAPRVAAGVEKPAPQPEPVAAPPKAAPDIEQPVRAALDRWTQAMRSGNTAAVAACYAPKLDRYFNERNATISEVKLNVSRSISRYGRPAILRISDVKITPESPDRAVAVFRKHWQTMGRKGFAGEEQERLTLENIAGNWRIASEEETHVYWTQRAR